MLGDLTLHDAPQLDHRDAGWCALAAVARFARVTQTLFTVGYEKRAIDEYVRLLASAGIDVLVDVRETPWSHKPGFSKGPLAAALENAGIQYVHAAYAGNPKWLRENAPTRAQCLNDYRRYISEFGEVVEAFDELVSSLTSAGRRVCITCFERHPDDCHRSVLASEWQRRGPQRAVRHLSPDGCARPDPAASV